MFHDIIKEKFIHARDLLINQAKKDPPDNPYKSKYEARSCLKSLATILCDQPDRGSIPNQNRLAVAYYLIATICYDVEEPSEGTEYGEKTLKILSEDPICPERIICYVSTLNILGFAACKYDKTDKSLELLNKAEGAYNSYKEKFSVAPIEFCANFGKPLVDNQNGLEKAFTTTLFYLAQVHSTRGERLISAKYCHTTLKRQLNFKDLDSIDWALNSATLSQYLIEQNAFKEAKSHLAAAQILLEKLAKNYETQEDDSEEAKAMKESLKHRTADIFRCWAKYGIYLMNASKERLISSEGDKLDPVPKPPEELKGLVFSDFGDEKIKEYESSITSEFLLTLEDAKPVFLVAQEWINKAKEYYTLENHASDHIFILQDSSQLYQLLAFFQSDEPTQCKLHKRRLDILDKAVNSLNPTYYMNACRDLWYELGEICLTMADLKRTQGENTNDQHFLTKSQHLYMQGIKYFEKYLDSFKLKKLNGAVEKYPEGHERSIIATQMFLGRMYSKLTSHEKAELIKTQSASLLYYGAVLEYCNSHKDIAELIPEELGICKEMVRLIPLKISKIERYM